MLQPTTPPPITTALAVLGRSMAPRVLRRSEEGPIVPRLEGGGFRHAEAASAKARDQLAVGRREVELLEALRRHPFPRLRLAGLDRSRLEAATIEMDHDRPLGVLPPDGLDPLAHGEARGQLLGELAPERLFQRLAGLALASRKLPESRQVRAGPALGDQVAARLVPDQGGDDLDETSHARSWRRSASWGRE